MRPCTGLARAQFAPLARARAASGTADSLCLFESRLLGLHGCLGCRNPKKKNGQFCSVKLGWLLKYPHSETASCVGVTAVITMRGRLESQYVGAEIGLLPGEAVPVLVSRSRFPIVILVWNGMGRYNPADCNHHVSFRTWHFLCKRTRSSEGRRRAGIPERNSRLVLAMFPDSGALLSCNHHSNAGSVWLLNIAQKAQSSLMPESLSDARLRTLFKTEQFWSDTRDSTS